MNNISSTHLAPLTLEAFQNRLRLNQFLITPVEEKGELSIKEEAFVSEDPAIQIKAFEETIAAANIAQDRAMAYSLVLGVALVTIRQRGLHRLRELNGRPSSFNEFVDYAATLGKPVSPSTLYRAERAATVWLYLRFCGINVSYCSAVLYEFHRVELIYTPQVHEQLKLIAQDTNQPTKEEALEAIGLFKGEKVTRKLSSYQSLKLHCGRCAKKLRTALEAGDVTAALTFVEEIEACAKTDSKKAARKKKPNSTTEVACSAAEPDPAVTPATQLVNAAESGNSFSCGLSKVEIRSSIIVIQHKGKNKRNEKAQSIVDSDSFKYDPVFFWWCKKFETEEAAQLRFSELRALLVGEQETVRKSGDEPPEASADQSHS